MSAQVTIPDLRTRIKQIQEAISSQDFAKILSALEDNYKDSIIFEKIMKGECKRYCEKCSIISWNTPNILRNFERNFDAKDFTDDSKFAQKLDYYNKFRIEMHNLIKRKSNLVSPFPEKQIEIDQQIRDDALSLVLSKESIIRLQKQKQYEEIRKNRKLLKTLEPEINTEYCAVVRIALFMIMRKVKALNEDQKHEIAERLKVDLLPLIEEDDVDIMELFEKKVAPIISEYSK